GAEITPIGGEVRIGKCLRTGHEIAGRAAARASLSKAMLHGLDLHVVPVRPKRAVNSAVMRRIAIPLRRSFPDAHRGQMWRLQRRYLPLVDRVIGNSIEADLSAAPRLLAGPG